MTFKRLLFLGLACFLFFESAHAEAILHALNGERIPLSSLKGKWVIVNYWANWCQPCLEEIPELNRFYRRFKNQNVVLLGVHYDELPQKELQQLIKSFHIQYPILNKDPAHWLPIEDIRGVPATFVFNPQGQLSRTLYGGQTLQSLSRAINMS